MPSWNPRERILREFPPEEPEAWRRGALEQLGEAGFELLFERRTVEGVPLAPIYRSGDLLGLEAQTTPPGFSPFTRGNSVLSERGWLIAQEVDEGDSHFGHDADTLEALREGEVIHLALGLPSRLGNSSLSIDELGTILGGADTASAAVFLDAGALSLQPLAVLGGYWRTLGLSFDQWQGAIASDPLGALARDGELPHALTRSFDEVAAATNWCAKHAPRMGTIWCHGEIWHDGGANAAQELGLTLAAVVASLRELEQRGIDPAPAVAHLHWSFAVGPVFFTEIAKLRAARMLLFRVLQSCGVREQDCHVPLHARTSRRCLTRQQPHLNLLRTTSEAFSAAVGGAETIHVDGFDAARSAESGFARRLARNLQYILRDEAFVAEVMDPGGGSYFLERMTAELAARAWAVLQEVEAKGGLESALREGWVQATIASAHEEALARAEVGDLVRIGVNKYPAASTEANAGAEAPPARERKRNGESVQKGRDPERVHAAESALAEAVAARARAKDEASAQTLVEAALSAAEARMSFRELSIVLSRGGQESSKVEPTPLRREAAPFEDFKERIETARAKGGKFSVLPITLGATAAHASRLGFARAFFEVGGFEVLPERRGEDSKQTLETVKSSKAAVLLLCATDEDCASDALALIERLKAARPESILVLAGQPGDSNLRARLEQAGVEEFVTSKSPVLATLEPLAKRLGVN